ncbi:MAG: phosphoribosylamine--glycine ligase [Nitrososphaerota archaeon]|nr:phosphoribosylamine--glycine ligase [Candidatus Bathyarchaeota archaeon]MDW8062012.1 phosphoribosylamine--glycine ligase [Nitrososphaerota archaeon]
MKVLLVGDGSREHAIAEALARSVKEPKIYALMHLINPGIAKVCEQSYGGYRRGSPIDPIQVANYAEELNVDFVFIGPEEPLFHGVADEVERRGIGCIGAHRAVAEVEMSKAYMRRLMWKYEIPGRLRFKSFKNVEDAIAYISEYAESLAIKPARQAGGKGVKVIADVQVYLSKEKREVKAKHAERVVKEHMRGYVDIEDRVLLEEKVEGPEYTLQCFSDGETILPMPLVQDNKHAYEDDLGPETGGMGSICGKGLILPFITMEEYSRSVEIVKKMVEAVQKETGELYRGVIAGQMMLTDKWGPTIIEMYSRFGQPEGENILPLLETDMVEICEAIIERKLSKVKLEFREKATVVKCIAPLGYPDRRDLARGHPIVVDEEAIARRGGKLFWSSVDTVDGMLVTGGSRACEIYAEADSIEEASEIAERCIPYVKLLDGWRLFHRSDIGTPRLLEKRRVLAELVREIYQYREKKGILGRTIDWIPGRGKIEL